MSNNFLQWNPNQTNQENDSQYLTDSQRLGGAANPSVFSSAVGNKLFYQVSTFIAAFAQALSNKGYNISDASLYSLASALSNVMTAADMGGYATQGYVRQGFLPITDAVLQGAPQTSTPPTADNSGRIPNTIWVKSQGYATLAYLAANFATQAWVSSTFAQQAYVAATFATYDWCNTYLQGKLGFQPVQQGGGISQSNNKIYIGFDSSQQLRATVDATDLGAICLKSDFRTYAALNGYQVLPSGIIIQWGYVGVSGTGTTITFPLVFPNAAISVVTSDGGGSGASGVHVCSAAVLNPGGFNLYAKDPGSGTPIFTNCSWIAIGY